jgi:hypothetical protein
MHTVLTLKGRIKNKLNITYCPTEWGLPLILSVRNILLALGVCMKICSLSKIMKYSMHFHNNHSYDAILFTSLQASLVGLLKTRMKHKTIEIRKCRLPGYIWNTKCIITTKSHRYNFQSYYYCFVLLNRDILGHMFSKLHVWNRRKHDTMRISISWYWWLSFICCSTLCRVCAMLLGCAWRQNNGRFKLLNQLAR